MKEDEVVRMLRGQRLERVHPVLRIVLWIGAVCAVALDVYSVAIENMLLAGVFTAVIVATLVFLAGKQLFKQRPNDVIGRR